MKLPGDYWASYEHTVSDLTEYVEAVQLISAYEATTGSRFAWRGAAGADWALHSSLFRAYEAAKKKTPTESQLQRLENEILEEARLWSLDWHESGGRLSALELLAALQHFEAPTRMLDFTFNALVALWFAVEKFEEMDGRVFAVDVSDRLVSREDALRTDPWWVSDKPEEWKARSWAWKPPPFVARIVRQDGCFLMGGVPSTEVPRNVLLGNGWEMLHAAEVRQCMSLPFQLINFEQAQAADRGQRLPGRVPKTKAFTLRVRNKEKIRTELERGFAYSHASIYPDFPGFALFAKTIPRES